MIKILSARYPYIVDNESEPYIRDYLNAKTEYERVTILSAFSSGFNECELLLARYTEINSNRFPLSLGKQDTDNNESFFQLSQKAKTAMAIYLAEKYMSQFEATHCAQLPKIYFRQPWSEQSLILNKKF